MTRYARRAYATISPMNLVLRLVIIEVVLIILGGLLLMTLWNWFMPVTFTGMPSLGLAAAIGINLVISLITYQYVPKPDVEFSDIVGAKLTLFAVYLIMGWIGQFFL